MTLVGILQTGHTPDELKDKCGDYDVFFKNLLKEQGFTFKTWAPIDMEFPNSANDADCWIVTGSRHGVYEDCPWITPLAAFIREIAKSEKRLLGICFGHQIIAHALGGKVEKYEGGWAIGPREYQLNNGQKLMLNAWHQDQVITPPKTAKVIGSNDFCQNAILTYGNEILSYQPHPEFDHEFMEDLFSARGNVLPEDTKKQVRLCLNEKTETNLIANQIGQFLKGDIAPDAIIY